jgi:Ribbon-helix-helix protein, copG family
MRPISVYVAEDHYRSFKTLAALSHRPVAELIREAMAAYLKRESRAPRSVLDISPHQSGKMLRTWTRSDLYDEMLEP